MRAKNLAELSACGIVIMSAAGLHEMTAVGEDRVRDGEEGGIEVGALSSHNNSLRGRVDTHTNHADNTSSNDAGDTDDTQPPQVVECTRQRAEESDDAEDGREFEVAESVVADEREGEHRFGIVLCLQFREYPI